MIFQHSGAKVLASRLGYRITAKFARAFLGRIFDHPARVFPEEFLRPEIQDLDAFVDGIRNVVEAQQRVAWQYFEDQSIEDACPPLLALLSIMAKGTFEGKDVHQPEIRRMFTLTISSGATGTVSDSLPNSRATSRSGNATCGTSMSALQIMYRCGRKILPSPYAAARLQWPNSNVQDPRLISRC